MPWGFQKVEAPRFQDSRLMKVVRSVIRTGRPYPPGYISGTHFSLGWANPRSIVPLSQWTNSIIPSGIEPVTFELLVAQCLNQLRHRFPERCQLLILCSGGDIWMNKGWWWYDAKQECSEKTAVLHRCTHCKSHMDRPGIIQLPAPCRGNLPALY
jgi:hypothetical protein